MVSWKLQLPEPKSVYSQQHLSPDLLPGPLNCVPREALNLVCKTCITICAGLQLMGCGRQITDEKMLLKKGNPAKNGYLYFFFVLSIVYTLKIILFLYFSYFINTIWFIFYLKIIVLHK